MGTKKTIVQLKNAKVIYILIYHSLQKIVPAQKKYKGYKKKTGIM